MRLIVTRPRPEAEKWVRALRAEGCDALALALIDVGPAPDPGPVALAWQAALHYRALMFVSANAVRYFFDQKPAVSLVFKGSSATETRAWSTGPGTTEALRAAGVAPHLIDSPDPQSPQLDSEALWRVVGPRVAAGDRVLIVRGRDRDRVRADVADAGDGREWLAQQLRSVHARPEFVVAYERGRPRFTPEEHSLARAAASDGSVWLFSSAEAVANLGTSLPDADWAGARALATHPRIAAAARSLGFVQVRLSRPGLRGVQASIESWP